MPTYEWLILDADGTLLDFHSAERDALRSTPHQLGVCVPENFESVYHDVNDGLWQQFERGELSARDIRTRRFHEVFVRLGIDSDSERFSEMFLANLVRASTFIDGAEALLHWLSQRARLLLLTNGFADVQHARIARLDLESTFAHVVISEEVGVAKPLPGIFDIAFQKMMNPPREKTLMLGDSLTSDIRGGADYGIDTCWYNPHDRANDTGLRPTYTIRHLSELPTYLDHRGRHA